MTVYVKTTWNTGDVITATKINNLETQYDDVFTGGTFSGQIGVFSYNLGTNALTISAGALTLDCSAGNVKTFTFNANITSSTPTNVPASGKFYQMILVATANGSSFTWSWLTSTVVWDGGVAPTFVTTNGHVMTFAVWTTNGGTTWRGLILASNYAS